MKIKVLASGSSGNCYIVTGKSDSLILEAGISWKQIVGEIDIRTVKGCLISHKHKDHSKSIGKVLESAIDVYCPQESAEGIQGHRLHHLKNLVAFTLGEFTIKPFNVHHTNADNTKCDTYGFIIQNSSQKLLFATDAYSIPYKFRNMDYIMIEANYSNDIFSPERQYEARTYKSHMSIDNCIKHLNNWDLKNTQEIMLIHLSNKNADGESFKNKIIAATGKQTIVAEPGASIGGQII